MSGLFVFRNVLPTDKRQETLARIIAYKNTFVGTQTPVVRTIALQDPTGDLAATIPVNAPVPPIKVERKSNGIDELRYLLLASQVELIDDSSKLQGLQHQATIDSGKIGVITAEGVKCDRCWNYSSTVGHSTEHPSVCDRCVDALAGEF